MEEDKICPICQKVFNAGYNQKRQITCSNSCSNTWRARDKVIQYCNFCKKEINKKRAIRGYKSVYCNKICEGEDRKRGTSKECEVCKKHFYISNSLINKRHTCSKICSNLRKRTLIINKKVNYRSFGECAMLILLRKNFPELIFKPNDRKELEGFEIDIYIPELKIGIEYNGPHHFKPVYGEEMLIKTQDRDKEKRKIAKLKGIKIVDINALESISPTTKRKTINLFIELCSQLNLKPSNLEFHAKNVIEEKFKKKENIIIDKRELKKYKLQKIDGNIIEINNLFLFCKENKLCHSTIYKTKKLDNYHKGYKLLPS